ncbi:MAG: serine/threonine-protein kinase [Pirellulaceae bacterium]
MMNPEDPRKPNLGAGHPDWKLESSAPPAECDAALTPVINLLEEVRQYEQRLAESLIDTDADDQVADESFTTESSMQFSRVGRFEILSKLGQGGFGVVFRAKDTLLKRDVALKIPRFESALSKETRQRFSREARAAATLSHPNIVSVFETGSDRGLDYLVCEFVDGRDLAKELEQAEGHMNAQAAAEIVLALADATEHAHRRGILHRDLKPSNVLIEKSSGSPRISDFGMAAVLNETQCQTQTGAAIGTPAFMSPEQATGNKARIGPTTDVYGLGAILYHLLSGRPPFQAATAVETIRAVCDHEPDRLNNTESPIPKDLAAICFKCLEKDPARRYSSAHLLAEDLQRFLDQRPVTARTISASRRLVRWASRNRALAAISSALAVSLIVGGSLLTYQFLSALTVNQQLTDSNNRLKNIVAAEKQARQIAEDNYRVSANLSEFLVGLFESSRPLNDGKDVTVASRLKQAYEKLKADEQVEPEIRATLLYAIGSSLRELGESQFALETLLLSEAALASNDEINPSRLIHTRSALGQTYSDLSRFEDAVTVLEPNLAAAKQHLGEHADSTHVAANNLAIALTKLGQSSRAIELLEPVLAFEREDPDRHGEPLATTLNNYAFALRAAGRLDEAVEHLQQTADVCDEYFGPNSFNRLLCEASLAEIYLAQKQSDKALPLARHAADELRKQVGATHAETLKAENLLVGCYFVSGDFDRAGEELQRLVQVSEELLGSAHENTLAFKYNLAGTMLRTGKDAQALPLFQAVWEAHQAQGRESLASAQRCLGHLAKLSWSTGDLESALEHYQTLIDFETKREAPRVDVLAQLTTDLASIEAERGDLLHSADTVRAFLKEHANSLSVAQRLQLLRLELDGLRGSETSEESARRLADFQSLLQRAKPELSDEQYSRLSAGVEFSAD